MDLNFVRRGHTGVYDRHSVWNVLIRRKAFNAPITGAEDLLILSLVVIVALSIPLGGRTGAHIEIEVLESRMSVAFAKWLMVIVKLMGTAFLGFFSWQLLRVGAVVRLRVGGDGL